MEASRGLCVKRQSTGLTVSAKAPGVLWGTSVLRAQLSTARVKSPEGEPHQAYGRLGFKNLSVLCKGSLVVPMAEAAEREPAPGSVAVARPGTERAGQPGGSKQGLVSEVPCSSRPGCQQSHRPVRKTGATNTRVSNFSVAVCSSGLRKK